MHFPRTSPGNENSLARGKLLERPPPSEKGRQDIAHVSVMEQQEQEEHTRLAQSDRDTQSSLMSIGTCSRKTLATITFEMLT